MKVDILGEKWLIEFKDISEDEKLNTRDGYTDNSIRKIVICNFERDSDSKQDLTQYTNRVLRHELIHAILSECGLQNESWACNEEMVDWIAIQFPKLEKIFKECEVK